MFNCSTSWILHIFLQGLSLSLPTPPLHPSQSARSSQGPTSSALTQTCQLCWSHNQPFPSGPIVPVPKCTDPSHTKSNLSDQSEPLPHSRPGPWTRTHIPHTSFCPPDFIPPKPFPTFRPNPPTHLLFCPNLFSSYQT